MKSILFTIMTAFTLTILLGCSQPPAPSQVPMPAPEDSKADTEVGTKRPTPPK
jgi:hypothetical protein